MLDLTQQLSATTSGKIDKALYEETKQKYDADRGDLKAAHAIAFTKQKQGMVFQRLLKI